MLLALHYAAVPAAVNVAQTFGMQSERRRTLRLNDRCSRSVHAFFHPIWLRHSSCPIRCQTCWSRRQDALNGEVGVFYEGDRAVHRHAEGERVMCQVVGASGLGLSVAIIPTGAEGLVYADEAGYLPEDGSGEPAALGDVLPAYIDKCRDDGKLDVSWRPPGTLPKLEAGAELLLTALLESDDGSLDLGDQSTPEAIRSALGLSKSNFKAARGRLLKAKLLEHPLDPYVTVLASSARSAPLRSAEAATGGAKPLAGRRA